jgi:hypothetical protein
MQEVYIIGNPGFVEQLNKALHDNRKYIRGQAAVEIPEKEVQLYWIANRKMLREFKHAIGADLVWKYRLNFFFDIEKFTQETTSTDEEWSADEKALMKRVIKSLAA